MLAKNHFVQIRVTDEERIRLGLLGVKMGLTYKGVIFRALQLLESEVDLQPVKLDD